MQLTMPVVNTDSVIPVLLMTRQFLGRWWTHLLLCFVSSSLLRLLTHFPANQLVWFSGFCWFPHQLYEHYLFSVYVDSAKYPSALSTMHAFENWCHWLECIRTWKPSCP